MGVPHGPSDEGVAVTSRAVGGLGKGEIAHPLLLNELERNHNAESKKGV